MTTNVSLLSYIFVILYYCHYYIQLLLIIIFVTIEFSFSNILNYCHKYNSDKSTSDNLTIVTRY